ncbi:hypothetical protein [Mesorhizobium sp. B1-1-8]|uniref:hypothetical protein n=1 Tax=Mesorhizobium sp. B1-1-8 TaxID=2589976 RepID=UPI0011273A7F|nr:hypothetical protein [Mesorhizobium sp. B1-1-8]UCI07080.1 hypothetical protein FJ974_25335 [Mesorhizobium sp. B1-1-8]
MNTKEIIGLSVLLGLVAFGRVAQLYIWPRLQVMDREDALNALIAPHMIRYAGLSFLMPGIVSPQLPPAFALPAAYGDLTASLLAIVATFALSARASWAITAVWLFNIEGSIDLLFAYYQGVVGIGLEPGVLGAAFYIPTVYVPLLLVSHFLVFRLLLKPAPRVRPHST